MWILPTRSRVKSLQRAIANYPEAPVLCVFTKGDPDLSLLEAVKLPPMWSRFLATPDSTVPQLLNQVLAHFPQEEYYGFIGDDVIPPSDLPWWEMLSQSAERICFAYPLDSIHGTKGAPHFCIGGDLVRAVGWLAAPWFYHNFIDTTWFFLARELGLRRILPDITFEHCHPLDKQYEHLDDDVYKRGRGHYKDDQHRFTLWAQQGGLHEQAQKVREKLNALYSNSAK